MDFNSRLVSLILLLHISGSVTLELFSVQCREQKICALRETQVTLKCSYLDNNITTGFWFSRKQSTNWRKHNEPEDVTLDSDYSGRLEQQITNKESNLIISDLRETDSGEYHLMFIMKDGVKYISPVAVNLTVTVLQVKMNLKHKWQKEISCITFCPLTSTPQNYYWIKNGQYVLTTTKPLMSSGELTDKGAGSYTCSISIDLKCRSSSICVTTLSKSNCWNVTYTSRRVCALVGSTVDIPSTYSHPTGYEVIQTFWHYVQPSVPFTDLSKKHQFAGRVEYVGNTLRIKDIRLNDSGEYQFRFITKTKEPFSGIPGVILNITDTQVTSSPANVSDGDEVILSCSTKCTLNNNPTYIWYKNGRPVTDGFTISNKLYLVSVSRKELDEFSCTIEDPEIQKARDSVKSNTLWNTVLILSVFLILALIGVLWYRRRKCNSSKPHEDTKEGVQSDSTTVVYNTELMSTACDATKEADIEGQDIHYSSIHFKQSHTSLTGGPGPDAVHYASVKFKTPDSN